MSGLIPFYQVRMGVWGVLGGAWLKKLASHVILETRTKEKLKVGGAQGSYAGEWMM